MSNHKQLSLRSLRELARKHLGRTQSHLKTREELVAALRRAVPQVIEALLGPPAQTAKPETPAAKAVEVTVVAEAALEKGPATVAAKAVAKVEPKAKTDVEASKAKLPTSPAKTAPAADPAEAPLTQGFFRQVPDSQRHPASQGRSRKAVPLMEGFFVARMAGERELSRHHLVEADVPFHDAVSALHFLGEESLGELPVTYDDDQVVLLPRDPRTLYFFWNFGPSLARVGAGTARLLVKLFDEEGMVRQEELELNARGFYLRELTPGRSYRIECYVRGSDGRLSSLRAVSNGVQLPDEGPSDDLDVRVMRVPWTSPVAAHEQQPAAASGLNDTDWIDTPAAPLSSSQDAPPSRRGVAPDWTQGAHLELPSSHSRRGGSGRR
jgi:hypothetical protein